MDNIPLKMEGLPSINDLLTQIHIAVREERDYQDLRWGTVKEHPHTPLEWLAIVLKKLRDGEEAWQKGDTSAPLKDMLEALAVIEAFRDQFEEYGGKLRSYRTILDSSEKSETGNYINLFHEDSCVTPMEYCIMVRITLAELFVQEAQLLRMADVSPGRVALHIEPVVVVLLSCFLHHGFIQRSPNNAHERIGAKRIARRFNYKRGL